jgi:lipopolysaccharide transport system ATP-binding protein
MIKDRLGQPIFGTNTQLLNQALKKIHRDAFINYTFKFKANLGCGTFSLAVALHSSENHLSKNYEWRDLALVFNVVNIGHATFVGTNWLPPSLEIIK